MNKVLKIENENFNLLSSYIESIENKIIRQNFINNDLIYVDQSILENNKNLISFKKLPINLKDNNLKIFELCVDYLINKFKIRKLWFMNYAPKTFLSFHVDDRKNRHVLSLNEDINFYSYEMDKNSNNNDWNFCTEKLKENINDIKKFNDFFISKNKDNVIINLEKNCVYSFGNNSHSFCNYSEKMRFAFVFEVFE